MWCWKRMDKIKWSEKVENEQILQFIGEKRTLLSNILRRKANWIRHTEKKLSSWCHLWTDDGNERSRKKKKKKKKNTAPK